MSILALVLFAGVLAAQPVRHVTGVVLDGTTKKPIFGAVVSAPAGKRLAVTNRSGRFEVTGVNLPSAVRVTAPHLAARLVDIPPAATDLDLGRVLLWRTGRITLVLSAAFAGQSVRWSIGQVAPGAKSVDVKREGKMPAAGPDLVIEGLEPAQYLLTLHGVGPLQYYAIPIALGAGDDASIPVTIAPVVVDLEVSMGDKPIPGPDVRFESVKSLWQGTVHCDEHGRASEELWQTGDFLVLALSEKGGVLYGEFKSFHEGDAHIRVEIRLPAHSIHGRVVDASTGASLSNANIGLKMPMRGVRATHSDDAGNFQFDAVPEGKHVIVAYKTGYRSDQTYTVEITADDGDVESTVSLEPASGERHVQVVDTAGMPIAGASTFFGEGSAVRPLEATDGNGVVAVPPGTGVLFAVPQSGSFAFRRIGSEELDPISLMVPLATGLLTITSESTKHDPIPWVVFILRVDGTIIPPSVVGRLASTQHLPFRTDADGRAQLSGLPPGLYDIWPARTRSDLDAILNGNPAAPAASVAVSSVPQAVTLTFRAAQ